MSLYLGNKKISTVIQTYTTADTDSLINQDKTVNPTTSTQVITVDNGYDILKSVTVRPVTSSIDSNILANNIRDGVEVLGVLGTLQEKLEDIPLSISPSTQRMIYTPSTGKTYSSVILAPVTSTIDSHILPENIKSGVTILGIEGTYETPTTTTTITPSRTMQTVNAPSGYAYSTVFVPAVTSSIDTNIKGENIKSGVRILGVSGTYETPASQLLISPSTQPKTYSPTSGQHYSSVVLSGVTSEIDENIKAENIKGGISILGVEGTYQPSLASKTLIPVHTNLYETTTYKASDEGLDGWDEVILRNIKLHSLIVYPESEAKTYYCNEGYDGIDSVTVAGDSNLVASNIKKGVSVLGVTGTFEGDSKYTKWEEAYHVNNSSVGTDVSSGSTNKYHFMIESGLIIEISTTATIYSGSNGSFSFKSNSENPTFNIYVNPKTYYKNSTSSVTNTYYVDDWYGTLQLVCNIPYTATITETSTWGSSSTPADSILNKSAKKYVISTTVPANTQFTFQMNVLV